MSTFCPFCEREVSEDDLRTDYVLEEIAFCDWCEDEYIDHCLEAEGHRRKMD